MRSWPRPLKLARPWLYVAGLLAAANLFFLVVGAPSFSITGYGNYVELLAGIGLEIVAILLYVYRRVVQDRERIVVQDRTEMVPNMALFREYFPESAIGTTSG